MIELFIMLQNTISELFSEPSGLESLVKEKEEEEKEKQLKAAQKSKKTEQKKTDTAEVQALAQFEKVSMLRCLRRRVLKVESCCL